MPLHDRSGPEVQADAEVLVKCGRHGPEEGSGEAYVTDYLSTIGDLEEFCRAARAQGADDRTPVDGSLGGLSVRIERRVAPLT